MWDLPGAGREPVSPALAGGFLTTAPTGKPSSKYFKELFRLANTLGEISQADAYDLCPIQVQFQTFNESFISLVRVREVANVFFSKTCLLQLLRFPISNLEFWFRKKFVYLAWPAQACFLSLIPGVLLEKLWGPWAA